MPKPDRGAILQFPFLAGFVVFLLFLSEHTFCFGSIADEADTAAVISGQPAYYSCLFQPVDAFLCRLRA